jgi:hypothetical protein
VAFQKETWDLVKEMFKEEIQFYFIIIFIFFAECASVEIPFKSALLKMQVKYGPL